MLTKSAENVLRYAVKQLGFSLARCPTRFVGARNFGKYMILNASLRPVIGMKGFAFSATADDVRAFIAERRKAAVS